MQDSDSFSLMMHKTGNKRSPERRASVGKRNNSSAEWETRQKRALTTVERADASPICGTEGVGRLVDALNQLRIFVPSEKGGEGQAEDVRAAYSGRKEVVESEDLMDSLKARLRSKETATYDDIYKRTMGRITVLEAAILLTRFVERIVLRTQDSVRRLYSTLNSDGLGISKAQVAEILSQLDCPQHVSPVTAEHICAEVVEQAVRDMRDEKREQFLVRSGHSLEADLRIKYPALERIVTNRWLLRFEFQRIFAVDFRPLFAKITRKTEESKAETEIAK